MRGTTCAQLRIVDAERWIPLSLHSLARLETSLPTLGILSSSIRDKTYLICP